MGEFPRCRPRGVTAVEPTFDEAEIETDRQPGQPETEDIHFGVSGASYQKQTDYAECGHHQSDNDVTYIAFHHKLSCSAGETVMTVAD
jgi:hypothetical protein